jgi:hypothetical protein
VTSDASVMTGGDAGPSVARALSEVARLLVDMAGWGKFTDQGITDSLCRGLMMVNSIISASFCILYHKLMPD